MTTVRVQSVAFTGIEAVHVEVEVQKSKGLFGKISIVGLPGGAVRESRDRVRAAVQASGFPFPRSALVINLAPADVRKEGPFFDLPMALGILAAARVIPSHSLEGYTVLGELALDGRVKPVPGTLAAAILAGERGQKGIVVANENRHEAGLVEGLKILPTHNLGHAASLFGGKAAQEELISCPNAPPDDISGKGKIVVGRETLDYKEVIGQETAKAAMVVAAAGGHNLLMIGPPGSGKTMLARRLPYILPALRREESLEVTRIHSFTKRGLRELIKDPPFRSPHHTISYAGLVGGGSTPGPGEVSLAHRGVLFLDELPEFQRRTLEALRQPLEEGIITIARARGTLSLPAQISLVASMNPCPCGFMGDTRNRCTCTRRQAFLYMKRISGPLLDRLDLQIEVPSIPPALLQKSCSGLDSRIMAESVRAARERQLRRTMPGEPRMNAHLSPRQIKKYCLLTFNAEAYLERCLTRYPLSARGYTRILKVARTVADLEGADRIDVSHVEKAVMFRVLDRLKTPEEY